MAEIDHIVLNLAAPLLLLGVTFIVAIMSFAVWEDRRAAAIVAHWAQRHDYEVIHRQRRKWWSGQGPFTSRSEHRVYYVTVRDLSGAERSGWVRPGSYTTLRTD